MTTLEDFEMVRVDVGGGVFAVVFADPDPWDGLDPVDDTDHPGTLYAWSGWNRDVGPHDGWRAVGRRRADGSRVRAQDAAGYVWSDDPDGWARETAAEVSAAGGLVVSVAFHDYGSGGSTFGPVDAIDDASGLLVIDAATVAAEWDGCDPDPLTAARAYADAFLSDVRAWVAGECYGWAVVTADGETVDSCYGYVGGDPYRADDYTRTVAVENAEWWRDAIAYHRAVLAATVEGPDLAAAMDAVRDLARIDRATDSEQVAA